MKQGVEKGLEKESIPTSFGFIQLHQQQCTAFKANYVPVEQTKLQWLNRLIKIVRSFNHAYNCDVLEPEGWCLSRKYEAGRLPGLDGNAKMSKSLNNGIYLTNDGYFSKVMSMYTDRIIFEWVRARGEENMVFHWI